MDLKRHSMDELLRSYADYSLFCRQDEGKIIDLSGYGNELSEDELDMVAAAVNLPWRANNKDKKS